VMSFREKGATILFVSHDLNLISQLCDRVLVLSQGKTSFLGPAEEAIDHYRQLIKRGEGLEIDPGLAERPVSMTDSRHWGNRQVEITSVCFFDKTGSPKNTFYSGDYFEARIFYFSHLEDSVPIFGIAINTVYKMLIYGPNTLETDFPKKIPKKGVVKFIIPFLPLFEGEYLFSVSAYDQTLNTAYDHHDMMYNFHVVSRETRDFGCVRINSHWEVESE